MPTPEPTIDATDLPIRIRSTTKYAIYGTILGIGVILASVAIVRLSRSRSALTTFLFAGLFLVTGSLLFALLFDPDLLVEGIRNMDDTVSTRRYIWLQPGTTVSFDPPERSRVPYPSGILVSWDRIPQSIYMILNGHQIRIDTILPFVQDMTSTSTSGQIYERVTIPVSTSYPIRSIINRALFNETTVDIQLDGSVNIHYTPRSLSGGDMLSDGTFVQTNVDTGYEIEDAIGRKLELVIPRLVVLPPAPMIVTRAEIIYPLPIQSLSINSSEIAVFSDTVYTIHLYTSRSVWFDDSESLYEATTDYLVHAHRTTSTYIALDLQFKASGIISLPIHGFHDVNDPTYTLRPLKLNVAVTPNENEFFVVD